jgi:anti-sigma factor RsiW
MQTPIDDMLLCAYVDGELDPAKSREIELLAAQNPAVRHRIEMYRRSGHLVREALSEGQFTRVPSGLRQAAERMIFRSNRRFHMRRALSAVAAVILGIGIGFVLSHFIEHGTVLPRSTVGNIMHDVAEYHPVYVREDEHLVEVPASRREHIEKWLGDRVGHPLRAPDLSAYGLRFEGARLVALHSEVLAQLMYTGPQGQRIALCVTRVDGALPEKPESTVEGGVRVHAIGKGRHVFLVAGPADEPVLDRLAGALPTLLTRS